MCRDCSSSRGTGSAWCCRSLSTSAAASVATPHPTHMASMYHSLLGHIVTVSSDQWCNWTHWHWLTSSPAWAWTWTWPSPAQLCTGSLTWQEGPVVHTPADWLTDWLSVSICTLGPLLTRQTGGWTQYDGEVTRWCNQYSIMIIDWHKVFQMIHISAHLQVQKVFLFEVFL